MHPRASARPRPGARRVRSPARPGRWRGLRRGPRDTSSWSATMRRNASTMGANRAGSRSSAPSACATASIVERWPSRRLAPQLAVAALAAGRASSRGSAASAGFIAQHLLRPGARCRPRRRACAAAGRRARRPACAPAPGKRSAVPGAATTSPRRAGPSSKRTPRWSSAFSSATRVSQAEQMASRASRGCWRRTTRVLDGIGPSPAQTQNVVGAQAAATGRAHVPAEESTRAASRRGRARAGGAAPRRPAGGRPCRALGAGARPPGRTDSRAQPRAGG